MAGTNEAEAAILSAISTMTKRAEEITGGGSTAPILNYATAINQMAEAYAWLRTPNNAHGGSVVGS